MDARLALVVLLVLAALAGLVFFRSESTKKRKKETKRYPIYVEGLHWLLRGETEAAAVSLRKAAEDGPYFMEARLRLGELLRGRGAWEQAIRIHNSLRVLPTLPAELTTETAIALARDYQSADQVGQAVIVLRDALSVEPEDSALLEQLMRLLEEAGRWDEAIDVANKLSKASGRSLSEETAMYDAERAREAMNAGNARKARSEIKRALADHPECAPARLLSGDLFIEKGDVDKAVNEWKRLAEDSPELATVAFCRIEKALYDAGKYGKIPEMYDDILQKQTGRFDVLLRLAEYQDRKGSVEVAAELCGSAIEANQDSIEPRVALAAYLSDLERCSEAAKTCREILDIIEMERSNFQCSNCSHTVSEYMSRCPSCNRVGSLLPKVCECSD